MSTIRRPCTLCSRDSVYAPCSELDPYDSRRLQCSFLPAALRTPSEASSPSSTATHSRPEAARTVSWDLTLLSFAVNALTKSNLPKPQRDALMDFFMEAAETPYYDGSAAIAATLQKELLDAITDVFVQHSPSQASALGLQSQSGRDSPSDTTASPAAVPLAATGAAPSLHRGLRLRRGASEASEWETLSGDRWITPDGNYIIEYIIDHHHYELYHWDDDWGFRIIGEHASLRSAQDDATTHRLYNHQQEFQT